MQPPFNLTAKINNLVSQISYRLGALDVLSMSIPEPKLRRKNHIRTIKGTLAIEGNTFTEEQITAILEKKRVIGSKKEIVEIKNAIALYENITTFRPHSTSSFLKAHQTLMVQLIERPGKYRSKNVGVLKGSVVKHVVPQPVMVPKLMSQLLDWIELEKELHPIIVSSIVHYEIEFIHPFEDGNGRMGRFWQSLVLYNFNPIFKFIPVESLVEKNQKSYYRVLEACDKQGDSTQFIEFMLSIILESIQEFDSEIDSVKTTSADRLNKAKQHFEDEAFSRKQYMELFKSISSATASRDLKEGSQRKLLNTHGNKNQTKYKFLKK